MGLAEAKGGDEGTFSIIIDEGAFSVGTDDEVGSVDIDRGSGRDVEGIGTGGGDVVLGEPYGSTGGAINQI